MASPNEVRVDMDAAPVTAGAIGIPADAADEPVTVEEEDIRKRLETEKSECLPGAPEWCGPKLIEINGCDKTCGFNPILYLIMFALIGSIAMIVSYSSETDS